MTQTHRLGHVTYPIRKDERYEITREYCGYVEPRLVLRFCGKWIAQTNGGPGELVMRAVQHNCDRMS